MLSLLLKVSFETNKDEVDKKQFGRLSFKDELKPVSAQMLTERIENEFFQVLDKNILVNDLCMLPDNKILAASCNQHKMILYDKNFEIIKEIDKIDDKVFSPLSLATDNDEKIYICDSFNQKILMTDLHFNLIGQYGRYGKNEEESVRYPNGMCYYEHVLYISDRGNNRILKLTNYLKHLKSFSIDFQASTIRILNDLACIKSVDRNSLFFYDLSYLPYFNFKYEYEEHKGTISIINSKFYEFNSKKRKIHCFDKNGTLEESFNIRQFKHDLELGIGASFYQLDKKIVLNCPEDRKIIGFDFL